MRKTDQTQRTNERRFAFTLVELLTVLAIVGILSAILIPATLSARVAARRTTTKLTFSQWVSALEHFRAEYGFYPSIADETGKLDSDRFAAALTARAVGGRRLGEDADLGGNFRRIGFYALTEDDLDATRTRLVDAFGNTDIVVLCDRDGDGAITASEGAAVAVRSARTGLSFAPAATELDLVAGVRRGVVIYSAGQGGTESDLVGNWR